MRVRVVSAVGLFPRVVPLFCTRFWVLSYRACTGTLGRSQVHEKIAAVHARRADLVSAINILSRAATALRAGRGGVAFAFVGDSAASAADATDAVDATDATAASDGGDDGVKLATVTRSLMQARRLREQFDLRWGFARDRTLGATLEVCVWVFVCVCVWVGDILSFTTSFPHHPDILGVRRSRRSNAAAWPRFVRPTTRGSRRGSESKYAPIWRAP